MSTCFERRVMGVRLVSLVIYRSYCSTPLPNIDQYTQDCSAPNFCYYTSHSILVGNLAIALSSNLLRSSSYSKGQDIDW